MERDERVANFRCFVDDWQVTLDNTCARRDLWRRLQASGVTVLDERERLLLPTLIDEADAEVRRVQAILLRMQRLLHRAVGGEDV